MTATKKVLLLAVMAFALVIARPSSARAACGPDNCSTDQWGCEMTAAQTCAVNGSGCYQLFDERCYYEWDEEAQDWCYMGASCGFFCCEE